MIMITSERKGKQIMLDYTDISSKVEDIKTALDSLYKLVYSQYDNIFQGKDAEKYQRMLQGIKSADRCMNEVNELNDRLSGVFENAFEEKFGEKMVNGKTNKSKDDDWQK